MENTGQIDFQSILPQKNINKPDQVEASIEDKKADPNENTQREIQNIHLQPRLDKDDVANEEEHKLVSAIDISNKPLLHAKTFSLFSFLQSEIIIDVTKVTFVMRELFMAKNTASVPVQDIVQVDLLSTPFFASIELKTLMSEEINRTFKITYLDKKQAHQAQDIIQGLEIAMKQGIDLTQVQNDSLLQQIEELGRSAV